MSVLVDYSTIQSIPEIWRIAADRFGDTPALEAPHDPSKIRWTYRELYEQIQSFAAGLQALGVSPKQEGELPPRLSLFADNSPRWFVADQGMMLAGAANAVRSAVADPEELLFILSHSDSQGLVVENWATWQRLAAQIPPDTLRFVVLLTDEPVPDSDSLGFPLLNFEQLMAKGRSALGQFQAPAIQREDLATLIYTSGTTGRPKGVMLSHRNLLHQICNAGVVVKPEVGDRVLSILPTWHSYERTVEYFLLSQGCTQIYTNIRQIKKDFATYAPQYMVSVPRIWESIYEGIQQELRKQPLKKQNLVQGFLNLSEAYLKAKRTATNLNLEHLRPSLLERGWAWIQGGLRWPGHTLATVLVYKTIAQKATGGKLKQVISGGGSLARHLDLFFEAIGVELLVGYGLTETAPILTVRRSEHNLRGSSGLPLAHTEIKIVHPETRQPLGLEERGLVLARGPQIMQGYFKNPEATTKAIDSEGWFDTGDLGMVVPQGDLVLTGRAKDTIVLTNGENIEPQPIEDACLRSPYVDQIMLVGQDQKSLGALIVPNCAALKQWASTHNLSLDLPEDLSTPLSPAQQLALETPQIQDLIRQELARQVKDRPSYRVDDRITVFRLLGEPFSMANGMMTQTLKIRRPVVTERYQAMIDEMFS